MSPFMIGGKIKNIPLASTNQGMRELLEIVDKFSYYFGYHVL